MHKRISLLLALGLSGAAQAYDFVDTATVTDVEPVYQSQRAQHCWDEQVPVQQQQNNVSDNSSLNAGTVIGGIAGGLLGHQIGEGNGKTAATAVGAVVGAMTGNNLHNRDSAYANSQPAYQTVRRCDAPSAPAISGYRVTLQYNGRQFTRTLNYNPGSTVQVGISLMD